MANKKIKAEISKKILHCFRDVNWRSQTFIINGKKIEDAQGGTEFYKKSEIDKVIEKLDKLMNSLIDTK